MSTRLTLAVLLVIATAITTERWLALHEHNNDLVQRITALSAPVRIDIEGSDLLQISRYRVIEESIDESASPQRILWLGLCDSSFGACAKANEMWRTFLRDMIPTDSVEVWMVAFSDADVTTAVDFQRLAGKRIRILRARDDRTFAQSLGLPNRPLAVVLTNTGRVSLLIEGPPTTDSLQDAMLRLRMTADVAVESSRLYRSLELYLPPDETSGEAPTTR